MAFQLQRNKDVVRLETSVKLRKSILAALGVGMLCLCLEVLPIPPRDMGNTVAGFSKSMALIWIAWMDFLIAFAAIIAMDDAINKITQWALGLAMGTLSLGVVGLLWKTPAWLIWWNFAFGVAFLGVATLFPLGRSRKKGRHGEEKKMRQAA